MTLCLIVSSDLMGASRFAQATRAAGCDSRQVRSLDALRATLAEGGMHVVIVDLGDPAGGAEAVRAGIEAGVPVAAVGPHVQTDLLEEAERLGAAVFPHSATGTHLVSWLTQTLSS